MKKIQAEKIHSLLYLERTQDMVLEIIEPNGHKTHNFIRLSLLHWVANYF